MCLQKLFEMCHNLRHGTMIEVRDARGNHIDYGSYADMHSLYGSIPIDCFSIDDNLHATIYLGWVKR